MKYRKSFFASVFVFAFLSFLTISVGIYSQRQRPTEKRGTAACSIQIESSGDRTAFLDCTNWGTIHEGQNC